MKKGVFFKGDPRTGKTLLSTILFNKDESLFLEGKSIKTINDKWVFSSASENTKYIIIDDVNPKLKIEEFFELLSSEKMKVNNNLKESIEIDTPMFVLIGNELNISSALFFQMFDVYDFNNLNFKDVVALIENRGIKICTN